MFVIWRWQSPQADLQIQHNLNENPNKQELISCFWNLYEREKRKERKEKSENFLKEFENNINVGELTR